MCAQLNLLLLLRQENSCEWILGQLENEGFSWRLLAPETEAELHAGLTPEPDLIFALDSLAHLPPGRVLDLLRERGLDTPLIVLCGAGDEAAAAAALEQGAADVIFRDRMKCLGWVIRRPVRDRKVREQKKQVEQAFRRSEARHQAMLKHSPALVFHKDMEGHYVLVNPQFEKSFNLAGSDILGKRDEEIFGPEQTQRFRNQERQVLASGLAQTSEERFASPSGERVVSLSTFPVRGADGEVTGIAGMGIDVTEQRQFETALRQSEKQYRNVVEGALEGLVIHQNGIVRFANRSAARLAGFERAEELVGRDTWHTFVAPEAWAELRARCEACSRGEPQTLHPGWPGIRRDGSRVWIQSSVALITWQGEPAFLSYFFDVTERKKSEELVRTSEERFSKAFHGSPLPVSIVTLEEGRYIDANASLASMIGLARDQIIGRTAREMGLWVNPDERKRLVELVTEFSIAKSFETKLRVADGTVRDVLISAEKFLLGPEQCMIVVTQDITERKRADESLRESEERFRQLADNINKVFWITNPESTRVIYVSPFYEQIWGRTRASLYQHPISWLDSVHPDDRARFHRDPLLKEPVENVYRILRPDGAVRWIRDRAFPLKDSAGDVRRVGGIAEDITEQRDLEEQLRQAQKMEAIGQLAGGIAHDFNNLLTIIQGHASLLSNADGSAAVIQEAAEQISAASERAAGLTRQLLTFSRRQRMQPRNLDLNEVIDRTGKMLHRILGEDIDLIFNHDPALPLVEADAGMLEQVLLNLAVNSRDAMPDGGRLVIGTSVAAITEAFLQQMPAARLGPAVCISFADTGCGIAPENLPRIFEPFFTTKAVGRGTGLGLATAYGIVNQHHGCIRVSSEVNRGTTFQLYFPASKNTTQVAAPSAAGTRERGGKELILLVEDERTLRLLVRGVLERYGYRVVEASSGKNALELWSEHRSQVDLLLTDMVMPDGMTGRQLADRLRTDRPNLKIIFSSGYSAELVGKGLLLQDGLNFLQKPYDPRVLAKTVRACLDAGV